MGKTPGASLFCFCARRRGAARLEVLEPRVMLAATSAYINAGGPAYVDTYGNHWAADTDYSGGSTTDVAYAVANTSNDPLYYSRRWGNFSYSIPLANGTYKLGLWFAEPRDDGVGERLFDVSAQGQAILTNFDIYATAGYQSATVQYFTVTVSSGVLNLVFTSVKDVACVGAISVAPIAVSGSSGTPLASPWSDSDIGSVGFAGSASEDSSGNITLSGSGADIWNDTDAFNFAYQPLVGNGSIVAQVSSEGDANAWSKVGVMIRETTNDDSRFVMLVVTPGSGVAFQDRTATHNTPSSISASGGVGEWLKLVRSGSTFTAYLSTNGSSWSEVGSVSIPMVNNVEAGLCVTAHDNTKLESATFSHVAIAASGVMASNWTDAATSLGDRWESESITYDGKLYIFGGFDSESMGETAECDVYDPATNTWSFLTDIPTGSLTHAGATLVGDTVYLAGGDMGTFTYGKTKTATAAVLTYNLDTGKWGSIASLPTAVSAGALVAINNVLYYYGGINATDTADVSNTWAFNLSDPAAGWVAKAAMPNARNHLGYAEINGIAYAIGGQHLYTEYSGNVAEVDAYNPVTNKWTTVASLPQPWSSFHVSTMVINGKIVIVGGQTNGGYDGIYQNLIDEFNPATNTWSNVGTIPEANEGLSTAYIDGELIAANGTVDNRGGWAQDQTWIDKSLSF